MSVKLISYSVPAEDMTDVIDNVQDLVAYCARVSNPTNQLNTETSDKLLNYLIKHRHWSPFEMVSACLEVTTTRDIARQILRHRSFSFQEFSQRYANPTEDLNFVLREARLQDHSNRQNSIEIHNRLLQEQWEMHQQEVIDLARSKYEWAIKSGIAKEQARVVLPEGLIESKLYINGTIRSWIHYLEVRTDASTQKEHRLIAQECAKVIAKVFPLINTP